MTLRTGIIQIGLDAVSPATNNFTIKAIQDGTLKIGVGNYDSHTNLVTLNSNGSLNFTSSITAASTITASAFVGNGAGLTGVISDAAAGGGIYLNSNTINSSYSMPAGKNGMSAGPMTLADGVGVTIADGCNWTIV
jgi:hypothetical protein